jgi:hypothetical protein
MFDSTTIKNMFYNSVGCNTAEIILESNNQLLSIFYHLNDNPVQHIWQDIHSDSKKFNMGITPGTSLDELVNKMNLLLTKTNRPLLDLPISQNQLNSLHNSFVENSKEILTDDELKINALIHAIESKNNVLTDYDATTKFYKDPDIRIPIKEEYKLWLTNENDWGHLLLGFATLGKSWKDIVKTNDNLQDLNTQKDITSETIMMFNADYPYRKASEQLLYKWAKSSNYQVPLDNLNQLALGSYFLGEVIITEVFLNFHPIVSDWYVPNHKCKLLWNKNVLGYKAQVKQINFFNSDMYFKTLLDHTGFQNV